METCCLLMWEWSRKTSFDMEGRTRRQHTHTAPETASDPDILREGQYNCSSFTLPNFWLVWRESRNGFTGPKTALQMPLFTLTFSRAIAHMVRCGRVSWPLPTSPFLPPPEIVGWHMASAMSDLISSFQYQVGEFADDKIYKHGVCFSR